MAELCRVGRADETVRHCASQQHCEDAVLNEVILGLVPGQDDQRLVGVEVIVCQERVKEIPGPLACNRDGAVVAVGCF